MCSERGGRLGSPLRSASIIVTLVLAGCASIISGSNQDVSFASEPPGARVLDHGTLLGSTPVIADLRRKEDHLIRIELDGYEPFEIALERGVNGWVWGNILFGGPIGLLVDLGTGAIRKLEPEQVVAELQTGGATRVELRDDHLYVFVRLEPEGHHEHLNTAKKRPPPYVWLLKEDLLFIRH